MCFYPVCIILRPAAALSATAWAPALPPALLPPGLRPGRAHGRLRSAAWAKAKFINNPRPPLWGGGARLAEDATSPPTLRHACSPPGATKGRESERGGWSSREPGGLARSDLPSGERPQARCLLGPPGLSSPQGPAGTRTPRLGTPSARRTRVSSYSDRGHSCSFSQFFFKGLRPNIEYSKIAICHFRLLSFLPKKKMVYSRTFVDSFINFPFHYT